MSIDSGFIYGFEVEKTSKQLDAIIWDSSKHSAVYKTKDFVIVPPESVIVVLSIKTTLKHKDLKSGLENLQSMVPLDLAFRWGGLGTAVDSICPPIVKFLVSYASASSPQEAQETISSFYCEQLATNPKLTEAVVPALQDVEPDGRWKLSLQKDDMMARVFPQLITAIESDESCYLRAWGPPDDLSGGRTFGPNLRRLPYIYRADAKITTSLEKLVFDVLAAVYRALGTHGYSVLAAWGDLSSNGTSVNYEREIVEREGLPLLNPEQLAGV